MASVRRFGLAARRVPVLLRRGLADQPANQPAADAPSQVHTVPKPALSYARMQPTLTPKALEKIQFNLEKYSKEGPSKTTSLKQAVRQEMSQVRRKFQLEVEQMREAFTIASAKEAQVFRKEVEARKLMKAKRAAENIQSHKTLQAAEKARNDQLRKDRSEKREKREAEHEEFMRSKLSAIEDDAKNFVTRDNIDEYIKRILAVPVSYSIGNITKEQIQELVEDDLAHLANIEVSESEEDEVSLRQLKLLDPSLRKK